MPKKNKSVPKDESRDPKDAPGFQAVVIADSFDQKMEPITFDKPRSLLPLVNIPLLDYTLEFLASSNVQEIFVFCCYKAEEIEEYISNSTWAHRPKLAVHTVLGTRSVSTGDALREIYSLGIITSDFVLVSGDVVSNLNLGPAMALHRQRRKKDKRTIMTAIFKKAAPNHRSRSIEDDTIVAVDPDTSQLLHFENEPSRRGVSLDVDIFAEHSAVQFRYDLLDCRIDICSPELLEVCTDNFDYNDLRQDVIKGIVNDEVYQYPIYTHVISGEYAARVNILRTYDSVSKDIIYRWTYPMTPDCNFLGTTSYTHRKSNIYQERDVSLARTSELGQHTVIGSGTQVGVGSVISHSVIGRDCKIGANVAINGAYLWDGVTIEDGAVINRSIVCNGATIGAGAVISDGCVVSYRVVVGPGLVLPANSKLTTHQTKPDDPDETVAVNIDLGENGVGYKWIEEDESNQLVSESLTVDEEDYPYIDDESEDSELPDDLPEKDRWHNEISETVSRAEAESHPLENLRVELNSLKLTFPDRTFFDLARACMSALIDIARKQVVESDSELKLNTGLKQILGRWGRLLQDYLGSLDHQVQLIHKLERISTKNADVALVFQDLMFILYENNVLEEEAIFNWEEVGSGSNPYVNQCSGFLEWLNQSSGEEESDEDSELGESSDE